MSFDQVFETILVEQKAAFLVVTLNRPHVGNATNTKLAQELIEVWEGVEADITIAAVILTGAGERFFSTGGDLKERATLDAEGWLRQHAIFNRNRQLMRECAVPIIAAVNGIAHGGGFETVLAADIVLCTAKAEFCLPEVKRGIIPGSGGTQLLPRKCGFAVAMQYILSGNSLSADEAYRHGLVAEVHETRDDMLAAAMDLAGAIGANAPLAVRQAKKAIRTAFSSDLETGMRFEREAYNNLVGTKDQVEGVRAFVEKRKPKFIGR